MRKSVIIADMLWIAVICYGCRCGHMISGDKEELLLEEIIYLYSKIQ